MKFNFPMAFTVTSLAWGLLEFKDAYNASGQLEYMYDCIRWPLEYLLKCHVSADELYVQVCCFYFIFAKSHEECFFFTVNIMPRAQKYS